jgi:uncharacterized membrane protein YozB (DUF420 family)
VREHRFYGAMSILSALAIVIGFGSTYGPRMIAGGPAVPAIVHLHALVFSCWVVLFVTQTMLVMRGRIAMHRRLGAPAMVLAGLMLVVGVMTSIAVTRLGHRGIPGVEFPDPGGFLLLNFASLAVFSVLTLAGWLYRQRPQIHKRLMLMAVMGGLTPPGLARMPMVSGNVPAIGAVVMAFVLAGPVYDLVTRRRIHPAFVCGLLVSLSAIPPIVTLVSETSGWRAVASWLLG